MDGEVQEIADFVGDSYYLAEKATTVSEDAIFVLWSFIYGRKCKNFKS